MRINQNISAMNTYSRLTSANTNKSGSLAKLSSGLRINKAGDDAAGLAISEKMRGQIGGLKQSVRNAQDGISLIQTAEGALTETHAILNRMRTLAVQASTDTNTDADRAEIQKEIDELATEITRISSDTQFNTMELLNGDMKEEGGQKLTFHIGANKGQNLKLNIEDMSARALNVAGNGGPLEKVSSGEYLGVAATNTYKSGDTVVAVDLGGTIYAAKDVFLDGAGALAVKQGTETFDIKTGVSIDGRIVDYTTGAATNATDINPAFVTSSTSTAVAFTGATLSDDNGIVAVQIGGGAGSWYAVDDVQLNSAENGLEAKTGAIALKDVDTAANYIESGEGGLNVSTQAAADKAITTIDEAINKVSAERSKLGATQNRLEHTINNLTATAENLSEAESRIRDVDMAEEMMEFTKNNILSQAATSMLAQANQMPQSVLQLLQ